MRTLTYYLAPKNGSILQEGKGQDVLSYVGESLKVWLDWKIVHSVMQIVNASKKRVMQFLIRNDLNTLEMKASLVLMSNRCLSMKAKVEMKKG